VRAFAQARARARALVNKYARRVRVRARIIHRSDRSGEYYGIYLIHPTHWLCRIRMLEIAIDHYIRRLPRTTANLRRPDLASARRKAKSRCDRRIRRKGILLSTEGARSIGEYRVANSGELPASWRLEISSLLFVRHPHVSRKPRFVFFPCQYPGEYTRCVVTFDSRSLQQQLEAFLLDERELRRFFLRHVETGKLYGD